MSKDKKKILKCQRKKSYVSFVEAERSRMQHPEKGCWLMSYHCGVCGKWHLAKKHKHIANAMTKLLRGTLFEETG